MTRTNWVDFKELRANLRFADVLRHFGVELKVRGDRATGFCPLPNHPKRDDGTKRTPSFSAHLGKGLFNCFGCHGSGNVLEFAALMSGVDSNDSTALRKVALDLQDWIFGDGGKSGAGAATHPLRLLKKPTATSVETGGAQQKPGEGLTRPVVVNAPLDFTLKMLDAEHPYLKERGFTAETISHFGLGYCARGLMQGRIAIPLHDAVGQLVGYAGRLVDETKVEEEHPKYRFPSAREREGKVYEFHKALLVYDLHAIARPVNDLVVCEGFASVWWCWQCGVADVVAVMGSSCSPEQGRLIAEAVSPGGRVWVLPDADAAGERCAQSVFAAVAPYRSVRWTKLERGQPTDLSADELHRLLTSGGYGMQP
jgi:DNA primase